jgi:hypothetical protein
MMNIEDQVRDVVGGTPGPNVIPAWETVTTRGRRIRSRRRIGRATLALGVAGAIVLGIVYATGSGDTSSRSIVANPAPGDATVTTSAGGSSDAHASVPGLGPALDPGPAAALSSGQDAVDVVDNAGKIRGFMKQSEGQRTLADGIVGRAVYDKTSGEVVGYMTSGPIGFVDLTLARDKKLLTQLLDCLNAYEAHVRDKADFSTACRDVLVAQGFNPTL